MPQDELVDELQKIRNIPGNIVNTGRKLFGMAPLGGGNSPSAGDTEASNAYMKAAAPKQPSAPINQPRVAPKPRPSSPAHAPVYHKGIDSVPKTGPAILKKDEAVLNTKDAAQYREAKGKGMAKDKVMNSAANALSGGKKEEKPKKEVSEMHIKRAANGGHIIKHKHSAPEHHPDEEHTTKGDDELAQHVMQHMGDQNPGEADADAGQSGVPPQAGASAAPPAGPPAAAPVAGAAAGM